MLQVELEEEQELETSNTQFKRVQRVIAKDLLGMGLSPLGVIVLAVVPQVQVME